uniref:Uncharacterized protein n=1 Tax=Arundo donax TaxID=35708 RepID=A0A0A9C4Y5_ARUDO
MISFMIPSRNVICQSELSPYCLSLRIGM